MFGTLAKLSSNNMNLRTKEVYGEFRNLPECGQRFVIYADPLTEGAIVREISTSAVTSVNRVREKIRFTTMNSEYLLTVTVGLYDA